MPPEDFTADNACPMASLFSSAPPSINAITSSLTMPPCRPRPRLSCKAFMIAVGNFKDSEGRLIKASN